MIQKLKFILLSLSLVLIVSCSNDNNVPTEPVEKNNKPQKIDLQTIDLPADLQTTDEEQVQQVLEYVRLSNKFVELKNAVNPPQETALTYIDGYWSGSWGYEDVMFYWEAWYEGEMYNVEVTADGSFYGFDFNNLKFLEVQSSSDGSKGSINLLGPNGTNLSQWNWMLEDGEVYTLNYYTPFGGMVYAEVNPDYSGKLEFYNNGNFVLGVVWESDGTWNWFTKKV